jgi:hypothetical protein
MIAVLAGGGLLGCSAADAGSSGTEQTAAPAASPLSAATLASPVTVTSTVPGGTIVAEPPVPTPEPAPVDGTCPYLADSVVAEINGQHTGTTQLVNVQPYPMCVFSRSDGGWLGSVRIIQAATPQAAVAAVDAHVPIEKSDPVSQPAGWAGGSMVTDTGSVYAVSKGTVAIVAESNQQQSIKGRQLVISTVGSLGL